jgi:hypothetical protein
MRSAAKAIDLMQLQKSRAAHQSWKHLRLSTRFSSNFLLNYRNLRRFLFYYIIGNTYGAILAFVLMLILIAIKVQLVGSGYEHYINYSPISLQDVASFLSWIWAASGVWLVLVTFNHWNEITSMLVTATAAGDISSYLSSFLALWYVTTFDMALEFFRKLISSPMDIMNTRAVYEIVLLWDNVEIMYGSIWTFWIQPVIGYITSYPLGSFFYDNLVNVGALIQTFGLGVKSLSSTVLSSGWTWLNTSILGVITPTTGSTLLQPMVDNIMKPIASALSISIIVWVLRVFFGWPF